MEEAEVVLLLEDALLCADLPRAAGLALQYPVEYRDPIFARTLNRVEKVLRDYPDDVHAGLLLLRAIATSDAGAAAVELGEPAAHLIDHRVLSLSLADRIPTWISELVWHLGEEVVDGTDHRLVTIETLCAEWGLHRPTAPRYLFALASALGGADAQGEGALAELLVADPDICAMIPPLLAASGVGRVMATGSWASAIASASRAGLIDRDTLLDLSLAQRGHDRAEDMQFFLVLHEELEPDNAEMSARVDAYERLLADDRQPVALAAAVGLYRRDERRPLPTSLLVNITRTLFSRQEPKLSSRHIGWLRGAVLRNPRSAGRLAVALIEGMATADRTLVEQSLDAVVAMLDVADIDAVDAVRAPLARAVSALPADIASVAAERIGLQLDYSVQDRAGRHAAPGKYSGDRAAAQSSRVARPGFTLPALPQRAKTLTDLAALTRDYLADLDPLFGEFVLDGIAALAGADLAATAEALAPLAPVLEGVSAADDTSDPGAWLGERPVLAALARLALPDNHPVHDHSWRVPAGPSGCLTRRAQEVLSRALAGQTQELLATPTTITGVVDPLVLAHRVRRLAAVASSGWPMDVEQALLRAHATHIEPTAIVALSEVNSPLSLRAERRLRQGVLARPTVQVTWSEGTSPRVTIGPPPPRPDDGPLTRQAFSLGEATAGAALTVLMTLPHHRELAAAHLVVPLADTDARHLSEDLRALALLGSAFGRTADATAVSLLFGAAQKHNDDRPAAVAALDRFALTWFDVEGCAEVWPSAATRSDIDLDRVATTLSELTPSKRSARLVWHLAGAARRAAEETGNPLITRLAAVEAAAGTVIGVPSGGAVLPGQATPNTLSASLI